MTRQLLYVAAPLAPTEADIAAVVDSEHQARPRTVPEKSQIALKRNIDRALRWLAWLRKSFPETTFIAPWIAAVMSGEDDADPKAREAGLVDACAVVERCDGVVLCGGRISSGMRREMEHGRDHSFVRFEEDPNAPAGQVFKVRPAGFEAYDLTAIGVEPPTQPAWFERTAAARTFVLWIEQGCKIWELVNKR